MPKTHTVELGEHLSGIAEKYGATVEVIWDHPSNAALKNKRKYPHVLFPGDQVSIPDNKQKEEPCDTGKVHRFRLRVSRLKLRIVLIDFHQQPIANAECDLKIENTTFKLKSDSAGLVEAVIPATAKEGKLQIKDLGIDCPIKIGHLHPIDEASGWKGRLMNLDYFAPGPAGEEAKDKVADKDTRHLRSAIEEFQCDNKIKVSGEMDAATQAKLKERHGI